MADTNLLRMPPDQHSFLNKTVSVIIPIYNSAPYLAETLDSVLSQTYSDLEIILIDDCSSDSSPQIISGYTSSHSNIVYHRLTTNSGAAVARNQALKISKGRHVAFLDSDDTWSAVKIERQLSLLTQKNAAICFTAIEMVDGDGNPIKQKIPVPLQADYALLLRNTIIATSTVVVDRAKTGPFEMPLLRGGQDYATWLMLLRNGNTAIGVNEPLVRYRKRGGSLSSSKLESIKQVWDIQTRQERISKPKAVLNVLHFLTNAIRKHF